WLDQNAHKYGFILRYPKGKEDATGIIYEPWHYRFVGEEYAKTIKDSGLCREEWLKENG
ncbi:MAG: D-alanyl-D-alanine carboxypeptidase family protein, partial [Oscillospiraceae bacterium]